MARPSMKAVGYAVLFGAIGSIILIYSISGDAINAAVTYSPMTDDRSESICEWRSASIQSLFGNITAKHPRRTECRQVQPMFSFVDDDGWLRLNQSAIGDRGVSCEYAQFDRGRTDRQLIFDRSIELVAPVRLERMDFVRVRCKSRDETTVYEEIHSHPVDHSAPENNQTLSNVGDEDRTLNVFVFLIESASTTMVRRHLPKTLEVLRQHLDAVTFDTVLKVGENTLPNMAALLTGLRTRDEQPNPANVTPILKRSSDGYFDQWPMIWNRFAERGYETTFLEDTIRHTTFHYGANGFRRKPVHHWYFPFWEAVRLTMAKSSQFCAGNRPIFEIFTDILRRHLLGERWRTKPQFLLAIFNDLSHDHVFDLERADDLWSAFFATLAERHSLNKTILIVAGDHGPRFTETRTTSAGYFEERLPFLSVALPSWFRRRFPNAYANLRTNSRRITSMFDVHATLRDVLYGRLDGGNVKDQQRTSGKIDENIRDDPTGDRVIVDYPSENRTIGNSLFEQLSPNRTCREIGVPHRYCLCGRTSVLESDSAMAERAAETVLQALTNIIRPLGPKCARLPSGTVLYFIRTPRPDDDRYPDSITYTVAVEVNVKGHRAAFEGSVRHFVLDDKFRFVSGTEERINSFGRQPCVDAPRDKKFCICTRTTKRFKQ